MQFYVFLECTWYPTDPPVYPRWVGKATKKAGGESDGEPCSNCGTLGATKKCSQCRQTQYCGEKCFKVRVGAT